jgi:hypothetical protein
VNVQLRFACRALAAITLIGVLGSAAADPLQTECAARAAIPDFVTHRVELVSDLPAGAPGDAPSLVVEPGGTCHAWPDGAHSAGGGFAS